MKMSDLDLKSVIVGVLLTVLVAAFVLVATTSSPRAWEYKRVSSISIEVPPEVTKLGEEGWEVVGYAHVKSTGQGNDYSEFVLKRAKRTSGTWEFWEKLWK